MTVASIVSLAATLCLGRFLFSHQRDGQSFEFADNADAPGSAWETTQTEVHLATIAIDYFTASVFAAVVWAVFAGINYEGDLIASLLVFYVVNAFFLLIIWRDNLQLYLFPESILSRKKRLLNTSINFPDQLDFFFQGVLVTSALFIALLYTGYAVLPKPSMHELGDAYVLAQAEALMSCVLRDICLQVVHRLQHYNYSAYQSHKTHHLISTRMSCFNGTVMDVSDFLFENYIGVLLCGILKHAYMQQSPLNMWSLLMVVWTNMALHSMNPLACVFLNPVLDLFVKGALAHAVHHLEPKKNLGFVPWHHFACNGYLRDMDMFNRGMGTRLE
ncbi:hypothetical protein HDU81_005524 [Chytriomyces hyalinus]|nr:hypothetical protein HDU81_005524 [Chytriomyces hyalinus]